MEVESPIRDIILATETEIEIIEIINKFDIVEKAWKDYNNSKFDVYYKLKNENFIRGLQVKAITKKRTRNTYTINGLHKYQDGMLIVCINKNDNMGLVFLSSQDTKVTSTNVKFVDNPKSFFSKNLTNLYNFKINLKRFLSLSIIVTDDVFEKSLSPTNLKEYKSVERFLSLCDKNLIKVERIENNGTVVDLLVDGFKAQMKFRSNAANIANGMYFYQIECSKSGGWKKQRIPYNEGDVELYIIELGCDLGYFLFLTEEDLIKEGYIKTNTQPGKTSLPVFPYNYMNRTDLPSKDAKQKKGNFTCDVEKWLF